MNDKNYPDKLYGIMDITTNKLVTNLTLLNHKFWEIKSYCKKALINYKKRYEKLLDKGNRVHPDNLKVVEFDLTLNRIIEE